jgi:hypothetical protein
MSTYRGSAEVVVIHEAVDGGEPDEVALHRNFVHHLKHCARTEGGLNSATNMLRLATRIRRTSE